MERGDVYNARLDPVEGSEQGGVRPVVIVSRNVINANSPVILAVPCTTYQENRRVYPTQVLVVAPEGGFSSDSILMADQVRVLAKDRLLKFRGRLNGEAIERLNQALLIALDLSSEQD
jgi:mRNA interferase MazF